MREKYTHGMKPFQTSQGTAWTGGYFIQAFQFLNITERNPHLLEEGDVLAPKPFATDGVGLVTDMPETHIFRFLRDRPLRLVHARRVP